MGGDACQAPSSPALAAAQQLRRHIQAKVSGTQRGIRTFADRWFCDLLDALDAPPASAEGERLQARQRIERLMDRWGEGRFVPFAARDGAGPHHQRDRALSDIPPEVLATSQGERECVRWRGLPVFKTVWDLALYPIILAEVRPGAILELGSGTGGSALWLAGMARALDLDLRIHSVDIRPPPGVSHPSVTFWHGDLRQPGDALGPQLAAQLGRPLVICEDAHVNTLEVLHRCAEIMRAGDYLVVEDSWLKRPALRSFTESVPGYLVDTRYTDFFGRNATCAQDSVLKRVVDTK